jgi:hypothetical protein
MALSSTVTSTATRHSLFVHTGEGCNRGTALVVPRICTPFVAIKFTCELRSFESITYRLETTEALYCR